MCDQIVKKMARNDPYEKSEEPGPYMVDNDKWGNPIVYTRTVDDDSVTHVVRSSGSDGVQDTSDDIVLEIKKPYIVKSVGKAIGKGIKDLGKGLWNGIFD
jgi:hypothetical protein